MATFGAEGLQSLALSGTESVDEFSDAALTRKRPRESFEDSFDDGQWDLNDDGRPKTRRVNPQRLAIRLGPDLVSEMEALIIPGAKMPTFTVRKDFQERYNVDRRHIYDYFHSRGLRVAKEDKHTNLIRGRAMKAQAQAQLQAISHPSPSTDPLVNKENIPSDVPVIRPFLVQTTQPPVKRRTVKRIPKVQEKKVRIHGGPRRTTSTRVSKAAKVLFDSDLLVTPPLSGYASESFMPTSPGTDTDWESLATCPQFTMPDEFDCLTGPVKEREIPDFLPSPDDFVSGYFESSDNAQPSFMDIESSLLPCDLDDMDALMTLDEHRLLNKEERNELYDLINNNIPMVGGVDEIYDDFMNDQSRSYFDDNLPPVIGYTDAPSHSKMGTPARNYSPKATDSPISLDIPDLRKWLTDDLDLCPEMDAHDFKPVRDSFEHSFI